MVPKWWEFEFINKRSLHRNYISVKELFVFKNHFCGTKIFHPEHPNEHKKNWSSKYITSFSVVDNNCFMTEF